MIGACPHSGGREIEESNVLGLVTKYYTRCEDKRLFSQDGIFCLTCGAYARVVNLK